MVIHICSSRARRGEISTHLCNIPLDVRTTVAYIPDGPPWPTEREIFQANLELIRQADEVHILWDGTSHGCLIELGAALALDKPVKIDSLASVGARWAAELPLRPNDLKPQQESEL